MRFQENSIFAKRSKFDRKSVRVRSSTQLHGHFAIFSAFGADLGSILLAPGRLGTLLGDVLAPRSILGAPWASPGAPLRRSRGAPGTLRYAPGTPLERPACSEVNFGSIWGARAASWEQFLVDLPWPNCPRRIALAVLCRSGSPWFNRSGCQTPRLAKKNRLAYRWAYIARSGRCACIVSSCLESSSFIFIIVEGRGWGS